MLTSLLPGLRELRTPLVVGWTWLVAFWILLADYLRTTVATPLVGDVVRVSGLLGQAVVIAVLSFVAYLVGSLIARDNMWESSASSRAPRGLWHPRDFLLRGGRRPNAV
jgi:hypothetical protein